MSPTSVSRMLSVFRPSRLGSLVTPTTTPSLRLPLPAKACTSSSLVNSATSSWKGLSEDSFEGVSYSSTSMTTLRPWWELSISDSRRRDPASVCRSALLRSIRSNVALSSGPIASESASSV